MDITSRRQSDLRIYSIIILTVIHLSVCSAVVDKLVRSKRFLEDAGTNRPATSKTTRIIPSNSQLVRCDACEYDTNCTATACSKDETYCMNVVQFYGNGSRKGITKRCANYLECKFDHSDPGCEYFSGTSARSKTCQFCCLATNDSKTCNENAIPSKVEWFGDTTVPSTLHSIDTTVNSNLLRCDTCEYGDNCTASACSEEETYCVNVLQFDEFGNSTVIKKTCANYLECKFDHSGQGCEFSNGIRTDSTTCQFCCLATNDSKTCNENPIPVKVEWFGDTTSTTTTASTTPTSTATTESTSPTSTATTTKDSTTSTSTATTTNDSTTSTSTATTASTTSTSTTTTASTTPTSTATATTNSTTPTSTATATTNSTTPTSTATTASTTSTSTTTSATTDSVTTEPTSLPSIVTTTYTTMKTTHTVNTNPLTTPGTEEPSTKPSSIPSSSSSVSALKTTSSAATTSAKFPLFTSAPKPTTRPIHSDASTTSPLIPRSTTKRPPYTLPPVTTVCEVCTATPDICDVLHHPTNCKPPNNYCINKIVNMRTGLRDVYRTCGNFSTCYRDWFLGSSDNDKCRTFDENNVVTLDFTCTFCCIKDECNKPLRPDDKTLYNDYQG